MMLHALQEQFHNLRHNRKWRHPIPPFICLGRALQGVNSFHTCLGEMERKVHAYFVKQIFLASAKKLCIGISPSLALHVDQICQPHTNIATLNDMCSRILHWINSRKLTQRLSVDKFSRRLENTRVGLKSWYKLASNIVTLCGTTQAQEVEVSDVFEKNGLDISVLCGQIKATRN